jgi:hypothetical protein
MRTITALLFLFLFIPSLSFAVQNAPDGWRYPNESDYNGDWQDFRKNTPVPFHVHADFNGDGFDDYAWLLLPTKGVGWGLFVFLSQKSGKPSIIKLIEDDTTVHYTRYGIALVNPGKYETCLGKEYDLGYPPDEPKVLVLTKPAINFFLYESANSFYWWEEKTQSFRSTCISD